MNLNDYIQEWCDNEKTCDTCPFQKECDKPKNIKLKCDTCARKNTDDCREFVRQVKAKRIKFTDCFLYVGEDEK